MNYYKSLFDNTVSQINDLKITKGVVDVDRDMKSVRFFLWLDNGKYISIAKKKKNMEIMMLYSVLLNHKNHG